MLLSIAKRWIEVRSQTHLQAFQTHCGSRASQASQVAVDVCVASVAPPMDSTQMGPDKSNNSPCLSLILISPGLPGIRDFLKLNNAVTMWQILTRESHQNARESSRGINPSESRRRCLVWGSSAPHERNSSSWYISRMSCICILDPKRGSQYSRCCSQRGGVVSRNRNKHAIRPESANQS